jgi:hypothetical protein
MGFYDYLNENTGLEEAYWNDQSVTLDPNEWNRILDLLDMISDTETTDRELAVKIRSQIKGVRPRTQYGTDVTYEPMPPRGK